LGDAFFQRTSTCVHNTAITDDETVSFARLAQLEVGVFNLDHGAQKIFLELEG
jgi:hypothetical protein